MFATDVSAVKRLAGPWSQVPPQGYVRMMVEYPKALWYPWREGGGKKKSACTIDSTNICLVNLLQKSCSQTIMSYLRFLESRVSRAYWITSSSSSNVTLEAQGPRPSEDRHTCCEGYGKWKQSEDFPLLYPKRWHRRNDMKRKEWKKLFVIQTTSHL